MEIATRSHLRMFTDHKNNYVHFICKLKGQHCLDIVAFPQDYGYCFDKDIFDKKHKFNCGFEGSNYRYQEIYNLFKLKKDLIEKFMV